MGMNTKMSFVLFFIMPGVLFSQTGGYYKSHECDLLKRYDANTSVTFYGDSRGDFVDKPFYGSNPNGWSMYLDLGARRDWNVQNLAKAGARIKGMYNKIVECTFDSADPTGFNQNYITATRYAFEIGGNDAIDNFFYLLAAPWRFHKSKEYINRGQGVIIDLLKLELESRDVADPGNNILMIGSYGAPAHGITTGTPADNCFPKGINNCVLPIEYACHRKISDTLPPQIINCSTGDVLADFILDKVTSRINIILSNDYNILDQMRIFINHAFGFNMTFEASLSPFEMWTNWATDGYSVMTIPSMLLGQVAQGEKTLAAEKGIHYVEMYGSLSYPFDAWWVGNPMLFTEVIHPNHFGFAVVGSRIGHWMGANGWDKPYSPPSPPVNAFTDPGPPDPTVPKWTIIDAILWCFFANYCHL